MNKIKLIVTVFLLYCSSIEAQVIKILFDASKAEMAGNADWVIDANTHNIGFPSGPAVTGAGTESNPAQIPSPAQSGITASTAETFWNGSLSAWGVDCVKRGYTVETLPYNGQITYGSSTNAQDLSHYKVFIICEPNIVFTTAEKTALMHFIQNGGGLFMVSDHDVSDRNGDGWDSPGIWNDFITTNSVQPNPFGIHFDLMNFSETTTNVVVAPADSILHGPMGNVTKAQWSNGTSMTINHTENPTVKAVIYKTGASTSGTTEVMCAYARYGSGKVAAIGDSSPCDDGTGDPGDVLYDGYFTDASGNHQLLLMNITIWLATTNAVTTSVTDEPVKWNWAVFPNPSSGAVSVVLPSNLDRTTEIKIYNIQGQLIRSGKVETSESMMNITLEAGSYFIQLISGQKSETKKLIIIN